MTKNIKTLINVSWLAGLALLFNIAFITSAQAVVIDFEGVLADGQSRVGHNVAPYTEDGFTLSSSGSPDVFHNDIFGDGFGYNDNGSDFFGWCGSCTGAPYTLSLTGGGLFNLSSIDFSNLNTGTDVGIINITGFFSGGGSITTAFDPFADVWSTVDFTGYSNLEYLTIGAASTGFNLAMDNIVLSAAEVSEPSSIALLGLVLLGLGFGRKRLF